ncbi:MAG: 3'-5' exonuclease [Gammaproteobacteria bacterium]
MQLFFDVETTGLPSRRGATYREVDVWPRIVSISWALASEPDQVVAHRSAIIRPDGFTIPWGAERVHGISTEMALRSGRRLDEVLEELAADCATHVPFRLVAHNMDFDRNVLFAELVRAGRTPPAPKLLRVLAGLPTFCTMLSSVNVCRLPGRYGDYKWPKLEELHQHLFGTTFAGAHDAAADVLACVRCFYAMRE